MYGTREEIPSQPTIRIKAYKKSYYSTERKNVSEDGGIMKS